MQVQLPISDQTDRCRSCGCERTRRRFKRKDRCGKCFYLFEYLRAVQRWDLSRPETLKHFAAMERRLGGRPTPSIQDMSVEDFAIFKANYIEQIQAALEQLRLREAKRRGDLRVDGLSIEHKLKDILRLIQLRDKYDRAAAKFHGLATMFDHTFSPDQCRILYNLLDDIEEQTYGRVAESYKALEAIYQKKRVEPVAAAWTRATIALQPAQSAAASGGGPNALWRLDLKGHVATREGRLRLLTVLDDHSSFVVALDACADDRPETIKRHMIGAFGLYGLPGRVVIDAASSRGQGPAALFTPLSIWLIEQDIAVAHPRLFHPQSTGRHEHFYRSFRAEVLGGLPFDGLADAARALARWRTRYNNERPPGVLDLEVPASRYNPDGRAYLERAAAFDYGPHDIVRRVQWGGRVSLLGRIVRLPKAFRGKDVAFRPTAHDGIFEVVFRIQTITTLDVRAVGRQGRSVQDVAEQAPPVAPSHAFAGQDGANTLPAA